MFKLKKVIFNYNANFYYRNNNKNITVLNKNFPDSYKNNWQVKMATIVKNNFFNNINFPFTIDLFVDKTFHWNSDFYKSKGIIPYRQPWVGCIQNTFSNYNDNFTVGLLLQKPDFLSSLPFCACLIVFSDYLKQQLLTEFAKIGGIKIPRRA